MTLAEKLTRSLGGTWFDAYGTACCPAHEDKNPSLSITDGMAGKLLLKCHAGCDYEAIRMALNGTDLRDHYNPNQCAAHDRSRQAERQAKRAAQNKRRETQARALWQAAKPIQGTPAEAYLRGRGITCALPSSLRYSETCWHPSGKRLPALICNVKGVVGFAVHRTYVNINGSGKANVIPNKAMLGFTKGGAVRLSHGAGKLVVAEGIETALSLLSGLVPNNLSVWAALSASGMAALRLPANPGKLTIAPDGDPVGRKAAERLAIRADALGWQVSLLSAPEGQDWNDVLCEKGVRT